MHTFLKTQIAGTTIIITSAGTVVTVHSNVSSKQKRDLILTYFQFLRNIYAYILLIARRAIVFAKYRQGQG